MHLREHEKYYHLMMIPGMVMLVIFSIIPLFGIVIAFQNFKPAKGIFGSAFVGLNNFRKAFMFSAFRQACVNTVIIAAGKIILNIIVPVFFAVVLNECSHAHFTKAVQTIVYLPHFLSWVVLAVIFNNIFSLTGLFNKLLGLFGVAPQMYMIKAQSFRHVIMWTDVWKHFGYNAIVYLAAITNIDQNIYEAAEIDGVSRVQRIWYMTLPSILPTIVLMSTLALGNILNAGFDQVYNMYSPLVYSTGDIIDTYVYRMGLENLQYSLATAVGLGKSAIGFLMIVTSYFLAGRFAGYSIF